MIDPVKAAALHAHLNEVLATPRRKRDELQDAQWRLECGEDEFAFFARAGLTPKAAFAAAQTALTAAQRKEADAEEIRLQSEAALRQAEHDGSLLAARSKSSL
jgi:hypothetical protein